MVVGGATRGQTRIAGSAMPSNSPCDLTQAPRFSQSPFLSCERGVLLHYILGPGTQLGKCSQLGKQCSSSTHINKQAKGM